MDRNKVIHIALNEVGYLEKSKTAYQQNPKILYDKTQGAGEDNYTKYGYEMSKLLPNVMDFPAYWCDAFVDWCFVQAYGASNAREMLCGNFDDYTVNSCKYYEKANRLDTIPQIGDQVFFTKNGKSSGCHHTGIVYDVDSNYFYTVEGNTSNASSVVSNGGGVAKKKYLIKQYQGKVLFGHPKYNDTVENLKSIDEIAQEVLDGKWGNEPARRTNLVSAGYNYALVKAKVNELYKARQEAQKNTDNSIAFQVWKFLMAKINNPYGVAGLMGNIQAESGINPKNLQNSCEKKLNMSDEEYVQAVDNGTYANFVNDSCGFGLCQWTSAGRKQGLYNTRNNRSIGDLNVQLEWLYKELCISFKPVLNGLKTAKSIREASDLVLTKFEKPKDQSDSVKIKRAGYGQYFYDKYSK